MQRATLSDMLVGALGGLVGSVAMNQFINAFYGAEKRRKLYERESGGQKQKKKSTDRPASVQTADKIAQLMLGRRLTDHELSIAGPGLHLAFGVGAGAIYGLLRSRYPKVAMLQGTIFGAGLCLVADETLMPLSGVAKGPAEYDAVNHLGSLGAHVVFGFTLESALTLFSETLSSGHSVEYGNSHL